MCVCVARPGHSLPATVGGDTRPRPKSAIGATGRFFFLLLLFFQYGPRAGLLPKNLLRRTPQRGHVGRPTRRATLARVRARRAAVASAPTAGALCTAERDAHTVPPRRRPAVRRRSITHARANNGRTPAPAFPCFFAKTPRGTADVRTFPKVGKIILKTIRGKPPRRFEPNKSALQTTYVPPSLVE